MNKIAELTNLGGFPLTQYTLDFMQQSYREALAAISRLIGNAVIVAGMEESPTNVTDGWISYNGELLPFSGGPKQSTWIIEEITENRRFADDQERTVYFTRRARFGSGGIPYANLQRIDTLLALKSTLAALNNRLSQKIDKVWKRGDVIEVDCDAAYLQANFDNTGLGKNERDGWAICNGLNGTRNRGGRFPVGYDPSRSDYNLLGRIGGQEFVTLTVNEMPSHMHTGNKQVSPRGWPKQSGDRTDRYYYIDGNKDDWWARETFDTAYTGGNGAHENRPPFFVTLWIMKL